MLSPADQRGRRPFRPDVVFLTHVWDAGAPPPREGQALTGERGIEASWRAYRAEDPGVLDARDATLPDLLVGQPFEGLACLAQARAYSSRPGFWIAAPTNRRPFGFDGQGWGRLDASRCSNGPCGPAAWTAGTCT